MSRYAGSGWNLPGSEWDRWVDRLMNEAWSAFHEGGPASVLTAPMLRLSENDDAFVVKADVPGVAPEDLKVEFENGRLTVSGEVRHESEEKSDDGFRSERSVDTFTRTLTMPAAVLKDKVTATCADGVLTVTLPRAIDESPRKVEIRGKKK